MQSSPYNLPAYATPTLSEVRLARGILLPGYYTLDSVRRYLIKVGNDKQQVVKVVMLGEQVLATVFGPIKHESLWNN